MEFTNIIVEKGNDFIASITLDRPKSLNTFNVALATELDGALRALDADKAVRVVIVKGSGKAFCAGIDVSDFFGKDLEAYRAWIACMEQPFVTIAAMRKPVIAMVHGVAAANGAGLVAAADLAIAADTARIGLTAINVGLNCIGPVVPVARSTGRKRAMEMLLFGNLYPASEAQSMGLVNRVVPEADLEREARAWAAALALKSPVALQHAKKAYYAAEDMDYATAFEFMNEAFALLCTTADAAEGIGAFLEKRTPVWKEA
jgi:enoyl-CoA hydratase/carnithine racemase